jgi:nucleoside-diphosphate-sugar epimerase
MKVLVTGASGFYGGAVAAALASRGDEVTTLQRRAVDGIGRCVQGDITDTEAVASAVAGQDAVVHLAAKVGVVGDAASFHRANVVGTEVALEAAERAGVRRFVYVSSPSVAHVGRSLVGEGAGPADPGHARGHYARTKAEGERLALASASAGFAVTAIRPHLVWGPGDEQLVGRIVARAHAGRLALIDDGAALIDTTYVDNAVDATVAALDRADEVSGRAFVVSNGEPRPVRDVLTAICEAMGAPPPRLKVPFRVAWGGGKLVETVWERLGREDDPPMTAFLAEQLATAHWFDQRDTREALAWTPRVSFDEGIRRLAAAAGEPDG